MPGTMTVENPILNSNETTISWAFQAENEFGYSPDLGPLLMQKFNKDIRYALSYEGIECGTVLLRLTLQQAAYAGRNVYLHRRSSITGSGYHVWPW